MTEPGPERDGVLRMQDGVRHWVRRTARHGGQGLRTASPTVLLSLLCASAVTPVALAAAGVTGAVAVAGAGLVSSVGGNLLSTVITEALDRLRERGKTEPSQEDLEEGIAGRIQDVLSAADDDARALRAEIATVLESVDASGVALRASIEAGDMGIRRDIITAFGELSEDFTEFRFLLDRVDTTAAQILANQDEQGIQQRMLLDRIGWAGTEARLAREEIAAWRNRPGQAADGQADQGPRWTSGSPYRGLLPFTEAEAGVFYGRERLTASLTGRLSQLPDRAGLVIVSGASGAGKSSLLRAGLLPALASGLHLPGSQHWPRIVMTPGTRPLAGLASHLAALGGGSAASVLDDLSADPGSARLAAGQAVIADARRAGRSADSGDAARLVLIVDQFEQVFAPDDSGSASGAGGSEGARESEEARRQAFITALSAAASHPAGPHGEPSALVVLAVRGDYWDQCAAYPELARALQDSSFVVGPMTETELRLAITGPAAAAGLRIQDTLTGTILSDLRAAGGASGHGILPLLSQALRLTWENRDENQLTIRGYDQAGRVAGAVETSADAVYDALPAAQRTLAREILTRMTAASGDGRISRRTVKRADLYAAHPAPERDQIDAILEALAAKRLVALADGTAEISHDALLQAWPRLRGWLEEDQASLILHTQLTEDATAWRANNDDRSYLYRGTQLAAVQEGADRWNSDPARYPPLTDTERDFLHTSARAATRATRQRRTIAAVLALLVIASLTGAGNAINAARTARQQTALAVSSQLATQSETLDSSDPYTAAQLAAASWHLDRNNPLARTSLLDTYTQPARGLISGDNLGAGVAFSPDGKTMATGDYDGTVRFWSNTTRKQIAAPIHVPGNIHEGTGVSYSPDGKFLATSDSDGTVRLWDAATHRQDGAPIQLPSSGIVNMVFGVAFSPDGKTLATADDDGTVRLWNTVTRRQVGAPIPVPSSGSGSHAVLGVAFSPDGRTMATTDDGGVARLWDADTRREIAVIPGSGINGIAFSPRSQILATTDEGGMIRLWNTATRRQVAAPIPVPRGNDLSGVAFRPDGRTLATTGADGTVRLWDTAVYAQIGAPIRVSGSSPPRVAFSPDGKTLAATGDEGVVRLWNTATHRQVGAPIRFPSSSGYVLGVAFSPDGKTLATGDEGSTVRLWSTITRRQTGAPISVPSGSGRAVYGVAFSPDGKTLATGGADGTVRLWNTVTHRQVGASIPVPDSDGAVSGVAFSPDGKVLATGDEGGPVRLWDAAARSQVGASIPVPGRGAATGVAFSPDGKVLATGGSDGTVRLWNIAFPGNLPDAVCAIAGRSLTRQQWSVYIPEEPFQEVCP